MFILKSIKTMPLLSVLMCGAAIVATLASPAAAQAQAVSAAPAPSADATINLLNLLVKRGVISRKDADALIKQANDEAVLSHTPASPNAAAAGPPVPAAVRPATSPATMVATTPPSDGSVHVLYVPDTVRQQIEDNVKDKVLADAKAGHWAAPGILPAWVQNLNLYGDIRLRY